MNSHSSPSGTSCSCHSNPNHPRQHKTSHHQPVTATHGHNHTFQKHTPSSRNNFSIKDRHRHEASYPEGPLKYTNKHRLNNAPDVEDDFVLIPSQPCAICDCIEAIFGGKPPKIPRRDSQQYCGNGCCKERPQSVDSEHNHHRRNFAHDQFLYHEPISRDHDIRREVSHTAKHSPPCDRGRTHYHDSFYPVDLDHDHYTSRRNDGSCDSLHDDQGYYSRSPSPSYPSDLDEPPTFSTPKKRYPHEHHYPTVQNSRYPSNSDIDFGVRLQPRRKQRETNKSFDNHYDNSLSSTIGQDGSTIGMKYLSLQQYDEIVDSQRQDYIASLNRENFLGGRVQRNACRVANGNSFGTPDVEYCGDEVQVDFKVDEGLLRDTRGYCAESSAMFRRDGTLKGVRKTVRFADGCL